MTETQWLELITDKITKSDSLKDGRKYYCSWWLRLDTEIPTATINYHLGKLCKKGMLEKHANMYATQYFLPKTDVN